MEYVVISNNKKLDKFIWRRYILPIEHLDMITEREPDGEEVYRFYNNYYCYYDRDTVAPFVKLENKFGRAIATLNPVVTEDYVADRPSIEMEDLTGIEVCFFDEKYIKRTANETYKLTCPEENELESLLAILFNEFPVDEYQILSYFESFKIGDMTEDESLKYMRDYMLENYGEGDL